MVGSSGSTVTLYRMGTETQTRWVMVTRQLAPSAPVSQVATGVPWQETVTVPTVISGVKVSGAVTATHCVPVCSQFLQFSSP